MIEVRRVDPRDRESWRSIVAACGGHALLLPDLYLFSHPEGRIQLLCFEEGGSPVGCAVLLDHAPGMLGRLRGRDHLAELPAAPALARPELAAAVRGSLFGRARATGASRLLVRPGSGDHLLGDEDLVPYRTGSITEFVLDLREGHEAVLAGMHKIHRKNVRRSARSAVEIVEDPSLAGLLRLRELQIASSRRAGERAEGFAVEPESFFHDLHANVYGPGLGSILFARHDGEEVAALAWLEALGRAVTVRSGSLPLGYELRAMYGLHDALVRGAISRGVVELNIGGVPTEAGDGQHPQSGLYEFKQGFGGRPVVRHGLDIPLAEIPE